jgi:hypothetical protein
MEVGAPTWNLPDITYKRRVSLGCKDGEITLDGTKLRDMVLDVDSYLNAPIAPELFWRDTRPHYYRLINPGSVYHLGSVHRFVDENATRSLPDFRGGAYSNDAQNFVKLIGYGLAFVSKNPKVAEIVDRMSILFKDAGAAFVWDSYGRMYAILFTGPGKSILPVNGQYIEGYVNGTDPMMSRMSSKQEVYNTIVGLCGDLTASAIGSAEVGACLTGGQFEVHGLGTTIGAAAHVSWGIPLNGLLHDEPGWGWYTLHTEAKWTMNTFRNYNNYNSDPLGKEDCNCK